MFTYKGKFKPKNASKYRGDPTNIIFRSLWERRVMRYFDENVNILEWSSEEMAIPYRSPMDNQIHRYFPDFIIKTKTKSGKISTIMIEVKPKKQTIQPEKTNKITKKYLTEVATWGVNQAKWKAAQEYCSERLWHFKILTEDQLGL